MSEPKYVWRETEKFLEWLISQGAYACLDWRKKGQKWQALIDGRGWFAPQWKDVPDDVVESCRPSCCPS